MDDQNAHRDTQSGPILVGLVIIFVGLAMLADRIGVSDIHLSGRFWPLVLIAFGCVRLAAPPVGRDGHRGSRWAGAWLIYLGLWFVVNTFHVLDFTYRTSWPLLIVGAGIGIIWRAIESAGRGSYPRIEEN